MPPPPPQIQFPSYGGESYRFECNDANDAMHVHRQLCLIILLLGIREKVNTEELFSLFVKCMVCLTVLFFNNQQIFTVLLSKLSWSAFRGDKILVFNTRSRVVSASSGFIAGHKVSGIRSKFPNLNENGQKSHFL